MEKVPQNENVTPANRRKQEAEKQALESNTQLLEDIQDDMSRNRSASICPSKLIKEYKADPNELLEAVEAKLVEGIRSLTTESLHHPMKKLNEISAVQLLSSASGGSALEGFYCLNDEGELQKIPGVLIAVSSALNICGPKNKVVVDKRAFDSNRAEANFMESVNQLGYSLSSKFKLKSAFVSVDAGASRSECARYANIQQSQTAQSYSSLVSYCYVPMASCLIEQDQVRFSQMALDELTKISLLLSKSASDKTIFEACRNFYSRFGSHACVGRIEFGGIYWWKSSAVGFAESERKDIESAVNEQAEAHLKASYCGFVGAGVDGKKSSNRENVKLTNNRSSKSKVHTTTEKTGGDPGAKDLDRWIESLSQNYDTWRVIDRDEQMIAVWDILPLHSAEFCNVMDLCDYLVEAYNTITGRNATISRDKQTITLLSEITRYKGQVLEWRTVDYMEFLLLLVNAKKRLTADVDRCADWVFLLRDDKIQSKIENLYEQRGKLSLYETVTVRGYLTYLLDELVYDVLSFPTKTDIMKWVACAGRDTADEQLLPSYNHVKNCEQLIKVLRKCANDFQGSSNVAEEEVIRLRVKVTTEIGLAIQYLARHASSKLELACVKSLVTSKGYSETHRVFLQLLSFSDLQYFEETLMNTMNEYVNLSKQSILTAQAFMLRSTIEFSCNNTTGWFDLHSDKEFFELQPELQDLIHQARAGSVNNESLRLKLTNIIDGNKVTPATSEDMLNEVIDKQFQEVFKQDGFAPSNVAAEVSGGRSSIMCEENEEFNDLLKRLKLDKCFPNKIKMMDILQVRRNFLAEQTSCSEDELVSMFLDRLMTMDFEARHLEADPELGANVTIFQQFEPTTENLTLEGFFQDESTSALAERNETGLSKIHPFDIQMAVYHCADNFVRQYLFTKLALCQYAVPIIVPCPNSDEIVMNLWSCREIKILMVDKSAKKDPVFRSVSVVQAKVPFVSFLRLSQSSISKSQMLSYLLNKQKHSTFHHRNCKGGNIKSILRQGTVEITWYCPGKTTDNDQFTKCLSFLNLHGDALKYKKQTEFLLAVSSLIVVLVSDLDLTGAGGSLLTRLLQSKTPVIALLIDKETTPTQRHAKKVKIAMRGRNEFDIRSDLFTAINELVSRSCVATSLADLAQQASKLNLKVDEELAICKNAMKSARKTIDLMNLTDCDYIKNKLFPLQGKLWTDWRDLDKSSRHLRNAANRGIENHASDIKMKKLKKRQQQLKAACPLNEFLLHVIHQLNNPDNDSLMYYVQWLRMEIFDLFSNRDGPQVENVFGFEHILREIGQLYEATELIQSEMREKLVNLPVRLLLQGYPLELMDGDAAYVPIQWVSAIFEKTKSYVDDGKLFVISVLGLQSSGKSTLLNALFGLQFNVGAGRCTRGAYMQFLRVADDLKTTLGFEFLLIIDTEGLHSPEKVRLLPASHDNELATFVIGLANLTVINIFGETQATIDDILQVSVQAFLRMREVKLYPSCVFVHQNVSDINAAQSNADGRRNMIEQLNKIIKIAAEQEHVSSCSFNDIIKFDVDEQTFYFAQLWLGSPPMAPPNPRYSQCVRELRRCIFDGGLIPDQYRTNWSQFSLRVNDLWNALQCESFVFSFRNSLEIIEYYKLTTAIGGWCDELNCVMSSQINEVGNTSQEQLVMHEIEIQFRDRIQIKLDDVFEKLKLYFNNTSDEHCIRAQWQQSTIHQLKEHTTQLLKQAINSVKASLELRRCQIVFENQQEEHERILRNGSKALASTLKAEAADDEKIAEEFDKLWTKWIADVSPTTEEKVTIEKINLDIQGKLTEEFPFYGGRTNVVLSYVSGKDFAIEIGKHIQFQHVYRLPSLIPHSQVHAEVEEKIDLIAKQIKELIEEQVKLTRRYSASHIDSVITRVRKSFTEFNEKKQKYKLTRDFEFELTVYLCFKSAIDWMKIENDFFSKYCPINALLKKKDILYHKFQSYCKGATEITLFVDDFGGALEYAIEVAVLKTTCSDLASVVKQDHAYLNSNRFVLNYALLERLAIEADFRKYVRYLTKPKQFFEEFVASCVEEYCTETKPEIVGVIALRALGELLLHVNKAICLATEKTSTQERDGLFWRDEVCRQLKTVLIIKAVADEAFNQPMTEIEYINSHILKTLAEMKVRLEEKFRKLSYKALLDAGVNPLDQLTLKQFGCWERCPFCKAVCMDPTEGHTGDHKPAFHRPGAVGGMHFHQTEQFDTATCSNNFLSDRCFTISSKQIDSEFMKFLWEKMTNRSGERRIMFKLYRTAGFPYDRWALKDLATDLNYWKWFVFTFKSDLEKHYHLKFEGSGTIPEEWGLHEKVTVLKELRNASKTCR